ncbi:MAG: hypothetical protein WCO55_01495 [Candidatus Falkowbacteria bacterium]
MAKKTITRTRTAFGFGFGRIKEKVVIETPDEVKRVETAKQPSKQTLPKKPKQQAKQSLPAKPKQQDKQLANKATPPAKQNNKAKPELKPANASPDKQGAKTKPAQNQPKTSPRKLGLAGLYQQQSNQKKTAPKRIEHKATPEQQERSYLNITRYPVYGKLDPRNDKESALYKVAAQNAVNHIVSGQLPNTWKLKPGIDLRYCNKCGRPFIPTYWQTQKETFQEHLVRVKGQAVYYNKLYDWQQLNATQIVPRLCQQGILWGKPEDHLK